MPGNIGIYMDLFCIPLRVVRKLCKLLRPRISAFYLRLTFKPQTICFSIDEQELCFVNFITCPFELCPR